MHSLYKGGYLYWVYVVKLDILSSLREHREHCKNASFKSPLGSRFDTYHLPLHSAWEVVLQGDLMELRVFSLRLRFNNFENW